MQAYSKDLRVRILADADRGVPTRQLATKYQVSESWVRRLKQRRRESGEITARKRRAFRPAILAPHYERLRQLVAAEPDSTLEELRRRLNVVVSLGALWNAIHRLGLTVKKKSSALRNKTART
jgi:transposase